MLHSGLTLLQFRECSIFNVVCFMCLKKILLVTALCLFSQVALSAMTITGTRVIFPGNEKEVSIRTNNKGKTPPLVQVWVDDGRMNVDVNSMKIPFLLTPPVYRVEPGKGQTVRLIYNGMLLPQDKESVYWFNMLEIPPAVKDDTNKLELAFRTRIKIFYRPDSLKSSGTASAEQLEWTLVDDVKKGRGIKITNPTPYFMSLDGGSLKVAGKEYPLNLDMLSPSSSSEFYPTTKLAAGSSVQNIHYRILNDFGAAIESTLVNHDGKGWHLSDDKKV